MATILQRGTKGKRDTQTGKLSLTVKWVVDDLAAVLTVGDAFVLGLPEIDRDFTQQIDGAGRYEVTIMYGGIDAKGPVNPGRQGGRWSGRITIREEPIETAPNFQALMTTYQGSLDDNGKVTWPATLTQKGGSTGLSGGKAASIKNKMFGVSTYPVLGGEVEHEYMEKSEPGDLLTRVGKVLAALPAGGPKTPKDYVWVTMCPEFEPHGTAWNIKDKYQLVHKDSYLSVVYQVIAR